MASFKFDVQFGTSHDLCIRNGVIVSSDSIIHDVTPVPWTCPTLDASLHRFKMLFGVKRRKAVTETFDDDEEPKKVPPKVEDSEESSDSEYEESMDSQDSEADDIDDDE